MAENNSLSANLSNQANLNNSRKTELSQFNFVVALGLGYLNKSADLKLKNRVDRKIPVNIHINKSGELELNGLNDNISDENIKIYTDKKETYSEDKVE